MFVLVLFTFETLFFALVPCILRLCAKQFYVKMNFVVGLLTTLVVLMLALVPVTVADCENSIIPELTFRLGGNNLNWPCYATKNIYASSGRYIPKNIIATRSQIYRDVAFVAIPRYRNGVPFTLGRIELRKGKCSVPIAPYPCWASQEEGNCQALQNVIDIFLDRQVSLPFVFYSYKLHLSAFIPAIFFLINGL